MDDIGSLRKTAGGYEFAYPELGLSVCGACVEWTLKAVVEIVVETEKLVARRELDDLEMLVEVSETQRIDRASSQSPEDARLNTIPHCIISVDGSEYLWGSASDRGSTSGSLTTKRY